MNSLNSDWSEACQRIEAANSIVIITHARPDGDAYGSALAMTEILLAQGKKVRFFNEDGVLERYRFLPGIERTELPPETAPEADLFISVDNAVLKRAGKVIAGWNLSIAINIDHHRSNEGFGEINLIDPNVPATAQLLFELFTQAGWEITPNIASQLFVAISTDTGSFKYRGTTARTFEVAAALARMGASTADLSHACFGTFPVRRTRLLKAILADLQFYSGDRIGAYSLTRRMFEETGALPEDTEGLIETVISTEGVDVALAFEERANHKVKMSFRAKGTVDVSELASRFGGGGHREASGAELEGSLEEVRRKVLVETARFIGAAAPVFVS
jgi:phosphoesterase RecJ-like protein